MRSVPCMRSWRSLDHLPLDDGWLVCPLDSVTKRGSTLGYFGVLCRVFVFRGRLFVFGWSLWSFRLYLGASLCTYAFLALPCF